MASLPVWFLQASSPLLGTSISEGSGVLVWVRKVGASASEQRLITAQHLLRTQAQRDGPYATQIKVWPPDVGFGDPTSILASIDLALSPDPATPLAEPEDFAFLCLPKDFTGADPAGLLADSACQPGLEQLTISGYSSGSDIIAIHQNVVLPAPHPDWKYENLLAASASGILSPGKGKPVGGVSGGGVFSSSKYAGVYRGGYETVGQHLFIPITRLRTWCLSRGYELMDLSVGGQIEIIKDQLIGLDSLKNDPTVKPLLAASSTALKSLQAVLSDFKIYKNLHDHLHQVQLQFTSASKSARGDLMDDDVYNQFDGAINTIDTALRNAQSTIDEIPAASSALIATEGAWLERLQSAVAEARNAAQNSAKAKSACTKIGRELRTQLPRINEALTTCAERMDLTHLGSLFQKLGAIPSLPPAMQSDFQAAQASCTQVFQNVSNQTELHGRWQDVDVSIWDAETALLVAIAGDPEQFLIQTQEINASLQPLMAATPWAYWVTRITSGLTDVGNLLAAGSMRPLASKFERLARDIRQLFFEVDQELKNKAEEVSTLGKPLEALV